MLRVALALVLFLFIGISAQAQTAPDRSATGGAQTLEDIMARQRGEPVDDSAWRNDVGDPNLAAPVPQLGPLGGTSDPELWRAIRYGSAETSVSAGGEVATVLMQDGGMKWLEWRQGRLQIWGFWMVVGTAGALLAFFLLRGRIRIDEAKTGRTVTRFKAIERFGHWLLGISFLVLGLTGLLVLFGRKFIAPLVGKDFNANLLLVSKVVHNNVSWAFMLGLIVVFVMWVIHNIPNRTDIVWLRQFGGIIGNAHPPAKKFNAGQKMIFWSVILLGAMISATGIALLFPFQFPIFGTTFGLMNEWGLGALVGLGDGSADMAPHEHMQMAQGWHAIAAFILMMIVTAHVYIGSIGMEGAFDAMGSGEVDEAWAHQHHSIWLEEVKAEAQKDKASPAE
ncbi:formate dehydrogenase subunit gamma [Shimia sp. W99]